ncbi:MAG: hypothetical protein ACRD0U_10955 [Acidimicrobiales bacterium]
MPTEVEQLLAAAADRTELGIRDLERRLRVLDVLSRNPEIDEVEIPPIVCITGLARSGTTLLHNLLALPGVATAHRTPRRSARLTAWASTRIVSCLE